MTKNGFIFSAAAKKRAFNLSGINMHTAHIVLQHHCLQSLALCAVLWMWPATDVWGVRKARLCWQQEAALALVSQLFSLGLIHVPLRVRVKVICLLVIMLLHKGVLQPATAD